jgi:hypothetical protein
MFTLSTDIAGCPDEPLLPPLDRIITVTCAPR